MIDLKERFVLRKEKIYFLFKEEKKEVKEFIQKQIRKRYIKLSKSLQIMVVFFIEKKDRKKRRVQDYWYLNE